MPPTKKRARRIRAGSQLRTSKCSVATGNPIRISTKHKRILDKVRSAASDALDCCDEAQNNIVRGERPFFAENIAMLALVVGRQKRLCRAVTVIKLLAAREARGQG